MYQIIYTPKFHNLKQKIFDCKTLKDVVNGLQGKHVLLILPKSEDTLEGRLQNWNKKGELVLWDSEHSTYAVRLKQK